MSFLRFLTRNRSAPVARDRLQVLLAHERALAGRADLVAVGRPHLYDPHWTLHAAAEQEYDGPGVSWPPPYRAGRRRPPTGRTDGPPPRLELIRRPPSGTRHARWRPGHADAEDR